MKTRALLAVMLVVAACSGALAAPLEGEYIEARTCDVYTGPCFANAEMGLCGNEAIMAWRIEKGEFEGVSLAGLSVAVVVNAERTLGDDGVFGFDPGHTRSVLLVDSRANRRQQAALIAFARKAAGRLASNVVAVRRVPMELRTDDASGRAHFRAAGLAEISTRELMHCDCICTNEIVYYQPLAKVSEAAPAYTLAMSYRGSELGNTWTNRELRSAFVGSFRFGSN